MNLIRLLTIALIIWIIYRFIRLALDRKQTTESTGTIRLVYCPYCNTRLPENKAIQVAGKYYCNKEHQQLDQES